MEEIPLAGIGDSPPSYSSIADTSAEPPQYPLPTAPPYSEVAEYLPPTAPPYSPPASPVPRELDVRADSQPDSSRSSQEEGEPAVYVCHMAFACVVFWCCNFLCGFIAFLLAS